jgi:hypothetical protein
MVTISIQQYKHPWPSGLRRSTQVRIYSYAWVQIPLDASSFFAAHISCELLDTLFSRAHFVNFWMCLNLNVKSARRLLRVQKGITP